MLKKGFDIGFKDADTRQGIVSGYFAMFGNKDLDGDIIERGAFSKTVMERGPAGKQLIKYLLDHDKNKVVAKITNLMEDEKGLYYEAKIGTHSAGQDFLKMIESELINQHSFGFKIMKEQYDQMAKANRIKEVLLYEGSAVQFLGANPETTFIGLKSLEEIEDQLKRYEKLIGQMKSFVKDGNATDETIMLIEKHMNRIIEIEYKSLQELLKPLKNTSKDLEADAINEILKNFKI